MNPPPPPQKKQEKIQICIDTYLDAQEISADRREEEKTERRENSPENTVRNDTAVKKCHVNWRN